MNRKMFLSELERQLRLNHVADIEDILEEYNVHFDIKLADGYSEEEISARLGNPKELAAQYVAQTGPAVRSGGSKAITAIGLAFADIVAVMVFALMFAWVIVLGAFAIACAATGICLAARLNIAGLIPFMPYGAALLLGISCLAMAVLSAIGAVYCWMFTVKVCNIYFNWHKAAWTANPSLPVLSRRMLGAKTQRNMKNAALISLVIFGVFGIIGLLTLMICAGSFEPWHYWKWFA